MGIQVTYLREVPDGYSLYGVYILRSIETDMDKAVKDHFEGIAAALGSQGMIASLLYWPGRKEAAKHFGLTLGDGSPVLIFIDVQPSQWTPQQKMLKIKLKDMTSYDETCKFLSQLTTWLADEDLGRVTWQIRLERLKRLADKLPAAIELLSGAASIASTIRGSA